VSPELERIGHLAQGDPKLCFSALAHHLDAEFLRETWQGLNKRGAAGRGLNLLVTQPEGDDRSVDSRFKPSHGRRVAHRVGRDALVVQ
jgi:hypothetical protein